MTGVAGLDPHPAISSAAAAAPTAARSSFFMRIGRKQGPPRWHRIDHTEVKLLLPAMDHLIAAPLWPMHGANLGALDRLAGLI